MPRLVPLLFGLCFCLLGEDSLAETTRDPMGDQLPVRIVQFTADGIERTVTAEVLTEALDGGVMLRGDDGRMWLVQPDQIIQSQDIDGALEVVSDQVIGERMRTELGESFGVYRTQHYVVLYDSNEPHARRVAALFESLYRVFNNYWKNQKFDIVKPRFPLVAIVLRDHDSFVQHAVEELGPSAKNMIGYYNLSSNVMTSFNVPNWERNVATIIHEATHQLAYNCGLQKRFADNPMWVSEGLATFFESPDMRSPGKWRGIGRVNQVNLARWRNYVGNRPQESLVTLLSDNKRFEQPASATQAYAESWALTYFLIRTKRKEYLEYMRRLSDGKTLEERSGRERVEMFTEVFGADLPKLDRAFVNYMRRVR